MPPVDCVSLMRFGYFVALLVLYFISSFGSSVKFHLQEFHVVGRAGVAAFS